MEHRRRSRHRHGRDRLVAELLRLRHVPGDGGHDGRRRRGEPDAGRAAQHDPQEGQQQPARQRQRRTSRRREPAGFNLPADLAARLGGTSGKGNRTDKYLDYGLRPRRADRQGQTLGLGPHRADRRQEHHADRLRRRDDPQELRVQGRRPAEQQHPRQLHVLRRQQDQERPQRRSDASVRKPAGTRPVRPRCTRARATSSSGRTCSRRRATPTSPAASSSRRPAGWTRTSTRTTTACITGRTCSTRRIGRRTSPAATPATSRATTSSSSASRGARRRSIRSASGPAAASSPSTTAIRTCRRS